MVLLVTRVEVLVLRVPIRESSFGSARHVVRLAPTLATIGSWLVSVRVIA